MCGAAGGCLTSMATLAKLREGSPWVQAGVGAAKHSHAMKGILAEP